MEKTYFDKLLEEYKGEKGNKSNLLTFTKYQILWLYVAVVECMSMKQMYFSKEEIPEMEAILQIGLELEEVLEVPKTENFNTMTICHYQHFFSQGHSFHFENGKYIE